MLQAQKYINFVINPPATLAKIKKYLVCKRKFKRAKM